ncbi:MAG: heparinase II/III family protein [Armatimonadetes bacterium]|nr:heparinase II/III family protein [Armatimonadota bacterium]
MCGDSWYENYTDELRRAGELLGRPDFVWIATQGKRGAQPSETSKVYPEAGYFIMRSDFGGQGRNYADARQLFIHNGGWFGSHGHWDLTSVNLYGYGRTLIIDPGQYEYKPAPGIDPYWSSRIHSMLVCEGQNVKREPGPSNWATNSVIDWFDGRHFGYSHMDGVDHVRRRVAYVKPDYFLFDDSARGTRDFNWAQVWNLTDPNARFDQQTGTIETTFDRGGNVIILNLEPGSLSVERATGITAAEEHPKTAILRLVRKVANPRFQSLVYPYDATRRPNVTWERILPDKPGLGDLFYSVRVKANGGVDWAVFGELGTCVFYRNGKHAVNADFALVRLDKTGNVRAFAWTRGRELKFNGTVIAKSEGTLHSLAVQYEGDRLLLEAREPDSTLAVAARNCKRFVLNGKPVSKPIIRKGLFFPFADRPMTLTSDDLAGFERITKTNEWTFIPDPAAWSGGYTHHETDPGRRESGEYVFRFPETRTYKVEVFLPKITITPSDSVEYRVSARFGKPVEPGGAVISAREEDGAYIFVLNQQIMSGWVKLGEFLFDRGLLRIRATNITSTDGLYFISDAVRLVW